MFTKNSFKIISFSGRAGSGKTELANICAANGYVKLSFATPLKLLVCKVTGLNSIEELNRLKNKPLGVSLDKEEYDILSDETGIEYNYVRATTGKLTELSTGRDWLQVIGTDFIRGADPDWHVKRTIAMMEPDKKYVFDDTRFPNELKALKELGAECWFIIRAKTDNVSNHISETALNYTMFDYNIIYNNKDLETFKNNWFYYFENHEASQYLRQYIIGNLFMSNGVGIETSMWEKFFVYEDFLNINDKIETPKKVKPTEDGKYLIVDGDIVQSPLKLEFYKKFI